MTSETALGGGETCSVARNSSYTNKRTKGQRVYMKHREVLYHHILLCSAVRLKLNK